MEIVEETLESSQTEDEINTLTHSYTSMLLDISNMHGSKREKLWEFTREELYKLLAIINPVCLHEKNSNNVKNINNIRIRIDS